MVGERKRQLDFTGREYRLLHHRIYRQSVSRRAWTRHYRVRAVNGQGSGTWSNVARASTDAAPPDAPTLLSASADGEKAIELKWSEPANMGGSAVSQYELQVSTDGGANWRRLTSPRASDRSYKHGGLKPGDTRHYRLRARNSAGWSQWSNTVSATTLSAVPAAPSLTARANGRTEIKLSWTKPDERGSVITLYELEASKDSRDWTAPVLNVTMSTTTTEYDHAGLEPGMTLHYRVRARNANGPGEWSRVRSATTVDTKVAVRAPSARRIRSSRTWKQQLQPGGTEPAPRRRCWWRTPG